MGFIQGALEEHVRAAGEQRRQPTPANEQAEQRASRALWVLPALLLRVPPAKAKSGAQETDGRETNKAIDARLVAAELGQAENLLRDYVQ